MFFFIKFDIVDYINKNYNKHRFVVEINKINFFLFLALLGLNKFVVFIINIIILYTTTYSPPSLNLDE